jgi:hypothetical protein
MPYLLLVNILFDISDSQCSSLQAQWPSCQDHRRQPGPIGPLARVGCPALPAEADTDFLLLLQLVVK